jgi:hypothetical protein
MRPWTSKSADDVEMRLTKGIEHLTGLGIDAIIVPPLWESFLAEKKPHILPIFETYMKTTVLPESRVGKLGVMSVQGNSWLQQAKKSLREIVSEYTLTEWQLSTKVFDKKFPVSVKDLSHRTLHLPYASKRSWMMRNLIKTDLRFFKDSDVDTLIPTDRGMFFREKMIRHRLGARMKFHWSAAMRESILHCLGTFSPLSEDKCIIRVSAAPEMLLANKERAQLFDWWGKRELVVHQIG